MFVDKRQWNMPQLQEHELYLLDERLYVEFLFEKNADEGQIDRARSFSLTTFVLSSIQILGEYPYSELMMNREKKREGFVDWQAVTCHIYSGDELIYEDIYDRVYGMGNGTSYLVNRP